MSINALGHRAHGPCLRFAERHRLVGGASSPAAMRGLALVVVFFAALIGVVPNADAQRAFARRFPATAAQPFTAQGDIALIGNHSLTCPASDGATCTGALDGSNTTARNNNFNMIAVNVDPDGGLNTNSSTASLDLPPGSIVVFAGLYWAGQASTASARTTVRLRAPAGGYLNVTASATDSIGSAYQSFVDITSIVTTAGNGAYTVANVAQTAGNGQWAGWTMVVAYRNTVTGVLRNLSVFDGFLLGNGTPSFQDINVSGFYTPITGVVNTNLGVVAYDGDKGQTDGGSSLEFGPNTGALTAVSNAANPVNDVWNSTISFEGAPVTTGRNPGSVNTLGLDIDNLKPNTPLAYGSTAAVLRVRSTASDVNYPGIVTLATDAFEPEIVTSFSKSASNDNGTGIFRPGDTLTYVIGLTNQGNDNSTNTVVSDPLPAGVSYVVGSLAVLSGPNAGAKTDGPGDDQANYDAGTRTVAFRVGSTANAMQGGIIAPTESTQLQFKVVIDADVGNGSNLSNVASVGYTSETSGLTGTGTNPPTSFTVSRDADASITKTGPTSVVSGGTVTYVVTVDSAGPDAADGATVSDDVPNALTGVTITCAASGGAVCPATAGLIDLTALAIPTLPAGGRVVFTIAGIAPASGALSNTASVAPPANTNDPTPGNNSAGPVVTAVDPIADVSMSKTLDTAGPYVVGQAVQYTLVVANAGPAAATSVQVSDTPTNLTVGAVSGACSALPCTIASIASGASATLTVQATLGGAATFDNSATATPAETDPDSTNNADTGNGGAAALVADLGVTIDRGGSGAVPTGTLVSYTVVVTNNGPSEATGAPLSVPVPSQLSGVTWSCEKIAAYCSAAAGTGSVSTGLNLASGQSITLTITGTAPTVSPASIDAVTATITASSGVTDSVAANNTATTPAIPVTALPISAEDDDAGTVNGAIGGAGVIDATTNDTLAGTPIVLGSGGNATLSPVTSGPLTVNADGSVDVASGTTSGTYSVAYTLCEVSNPGNCDTAAVSVTVVAGAIAAGNDTAGPVPGTAGATAVVDVVSNDTLQGLPIVLGPGGNATLAPATSGPLTINADGRADVAPNTPAGLYTAVYTVCDAANPGNCASATVSVTVVAGMIVATADNAGPVNGASGGTVAGVDVIANDTLDGAPVVLGGAGNATLAPVTIGALTVNADGTVSVAPGTPAGSLTATYTLCEAINSGNCASATVTVVVEAAPIVAINDTAGPINGGSGGDAGIDSISNDTLGGNPIVLGTGGNAALVQVTRGPLTVNADGTVSVAPGTPAGTYIVIYTVCEALNPTNCASATVAVGVAAASLTANDDLASTSQNTPVITPVLGNDRLSSVPIAATEVFVTIATAPSNGSAQVNVDGTIVYAPNANFSGPDSFAYKICETLNPTNCASATVGVSIAQNVITVVDDVAVTAQTEPLTINVIGNDRSTGSPLNQSSVTVVQLPSNGTVACTGGVCTYVPNPLFFGTDTFTYRVCDVSTPTPVCATASVTLTVNASTPMLRVSKQAATRRVSVGDLVRYVVTIENTGLVPIIGYTLLDVPPAGFTYVDGSLSVDDGDDGGALESINPLRVAGIDIAVGARASVAYVLRVGAGVSRGSHTNRASMLNPNGTLIGNPGTSDVEVEGDPLLDTSLIVGTVFDDLDGNGVQVEGERGIPGVRIASVEGLLMQTDAYGRYHLEGVDVGTRARGRNFILKVDTATLPPGAVFTSENPRVRRVTQGLPVRFDFGVRLPRDPGTPPVPTPGPGDTSSPGSRNAASPVSDTDGR